MNRKGFIATLVGLLGISTVKGNIKLGTPQLSKDRFLRKYPLTPDQCIMPGNPDWQPNIKNPIIVIANQDNVPVTLNAPDNIIWDVHYHNGDGIWKKYPINSNGNYQLTKDYTYSFKQTKI